MDVMTKTLDGCEVFINTHTQKPDFGQEFSVEVVTVGYGIQEFSDALACNLTFATVPPTPEDIFLDSICVPTQAEVRNQMGSKLAEVFFEDLSSEGRIILGLQPPLIGPGQIWIPAGSRLKNKVRCKPVPEPQVLHLKALTHRAILAVGKKYMDMKDAMQMLQCEEQLMLQKSRLEAECSLKVKAALDQAKIESDEHCKKVVGSLMEHFDRSFAELATESKLRMRKECQNRVREERSELAAYMFLQLQEELKKRDRELCSDFHDTLYRELNVLATRYVEQIDTERKAAQEVLEDVIRDYENQLVDLKAEMEITSMVDVSRAILEEQRKAMENESGAQASTNKKFEGFKKKLELLENENITLREMATERSMRIREYETKMRKLLEEFQKFMNFALKAEPAHAEFLVSVEKANVTKYHQDGILDPNEYRRFMDCLAGKTREAELEWPGEAEEQSEVSCVIPEEEVEEDMMDDLKKPKSKCLAAEGDKYRFNYYRYKYTLLKNLIKGIQFNAASTTPSERKSEKIVKEESEPEEEQVQADEQYKATLALAGENMKDHLGPVETFLKSRKEALMDICRKDPITARATLSCKDQVPPEKKPPPKKKIYCFRGSTAPKPESPC